MDGENEKKLSRILFLIVLVVIIIVLIPVCSYLFKTDRYGYKLPDYVKNKSTTKVVDKSYKELSEKEKIKYNEMLLDSNFLLPISNAIKNNLNIFGINLIQSDESKFIYAYTNLKLKDIQNINLDMLNEIIKDTFNYEITGEYIKNYYKNDEYIYNYNNDYTFCLKATNKKEENNVLYLKFDLLDYNDELCNTNRFDYNASKAGIITYNIVNDKYYINSFKIMKKEGREE